MRILRNGLIPVSACDVTGVQSKTFNRLWKKATGKP